jgi:hypothetical protein
MLPSGDGIEMPAEQAERVRAQAYKMQVSRIENQSLVGPGNELVVSLEIEQRIANFAQRGRIFGCSCVRRQRSLQFPLVALHRVYRRMMNCPAKNTNPTTMQTNPIVCFARGEMSRTFPIS